MEERRDKQPPPEPGAQPPVLPVAGKLSPVQEAWGAYVGHALKCPICRSRDAGSCDDAEQLHRTYKQVEANAHRQVWEAS